MSALLGAQHAQRLHPLHQGALLSGTGGATAWRELLFWSGIGAAAPRRTPAHHVRRGDRKTVSRKVRTCTPGVSAEACRQRQGILCSYCCGLNPTGLAFLWRVVAKGRHSRSFRTPSAMGASQSGRDDHCIRQDRCVFVLSFQVLHWYARWGKHG